MHARGGSSVGVRRQLGVLSDSGLRVFGKPLYLLSHSVALKYILFGTEEKQMCKSFTVVFRVCLHVDRSVLNSIDPSSSGC